MLFTSTTSACMCSAIQTCSSNVDTRTELRTGTTACLPAVLRCRTKARTTLDRRLVSITHRKRRRTKKQESTWVIFGESQNPATGRLHPLYTQPVPMQYEYALYVGYTLLSGLPTRGLFIFFCALQRTMWGNILACEREWQRVCLSSDRTAAQGRSTKQL
jgi:hypothetical protein